MVLKILASGSLLLACLGCVSIAADQPLTEYRPTAAQSRDYIASGPAVVSLWRWQADRSSMTQAALAAQHDNRGIIELPIEVKRLSVDSGTPLGFRAVNGQVVAIAGNRQIPLPGGHYSWQILSQDPRVPIPAEYHSHGEITVWSTNCDPYYDAVGMPVAQAW